VTLLFAQPISLLFLGGFALSLLGMLALRHTAPGKSAQDDDASGHQELVFQGDMLVDACPRARIALSHEDLEEGPLRWIASRTAPGSW